jgi:hypothetical protein
MIGVGTVGAWSTAQAGSLTRATPPIDTVATTHQHTALPSQGGATVSVLHLPLAQGRYVVSAAATLVNFDPSDYTRCQVTLDGTEVGSATAMVGDGTRGTNGDGALVVPIAMNGTAVVGVGGGSLELRCWHDADGRAPYVDGSPTLVAHRTTSLKRITE